MVDIDGVISLFGRCGSGCRRATAWAAAPTLAPTVDRSTAPSTRSTAYPTSFRPRPPLTCLSCRPCSTWCGPAAGRSGPTSTSPTCWGCRRRCRSCASRACRTPTGRSNAHWKLEAIDAYAGGRPLAWIDDALNPACHEWAAGPCGADAARPDRAGARPHRRGRRGGWRGGLERATQERHGEAADAQTRRQPASPRVTTPPPSVLRREARARPAPRRSRGRCRRRRSSPARRGRRRTPVRSRR